MVQERESCGPICRFVYFMLDEQWEVAKAEFDRLLMSKDLPAFIYYISKDGPTGSTDPVEVLGDAYHRVLESGFANESVQLLQRVIANPGCLQSLVDLLFTEGSEYWMQQLAPATAEEEATVERIRAAVMQKISQTEPTTE